MSDPSPESLRFAAIVLGKMHGCYRGDQQESVAEWFDEAAQRAAVGAAVP